MKVVTQWDYLWEPVIAGGATALVLCLFTGLIGIPYEDGASQRTARLFSRKFWTGPLKASSAWTFTDSWATNITALGTAIVAILAASDTLAAIFPKVDINPFIVMSVVCGAIVAVAPLLFAIVNVPCRRGDSANSAEEPDTNVVVADMRSLMSAAALTMFGIGSESWMIGLLARRFSDASSNGQITALVISIVTLLGLIVYGGTSIRALAETRPGSSLSAQSRASFIL